MRLVATGGRLKALSTQKSNLLLRLRQSKSTEEKSQIQCELGHLSNRLNRLLAQPVLTEHAILRYLERVKGIDIAAIEREILNPETVNIINTHGIGPSKIPLTTVRGCRLIVEDKTIITIEVA